MSCHDSVSWLERTHRLPRRAPQGGKSHGSSGRAARGKIEVNRSSVTA